MGDRVAWKKRNRKAKREDLGRKRGRSRGSGEEVERFGGLGEADACAAVAGGSCGAGLTSAATGEDTGFCARLGVDLDTGHGTASSTRTDRGINTAISGANTFGCVGEGKAEEALRAAFGSHFGGVGGANAAECNGADGGFAKASVAEVCATFEARGAGFSASTVSKATAKGGACGGLEANAFCASAAGFSGGLAGAFPDLDADGFGAVEAETLETTRAKIGGVDLVFGGIEFLASGVLLEGTGPTASATATVEGEALGVTGARSAGAGGAFFEAVGDGCAGSVVEADADVIVSATFGATAFFEGSDDGLLDTGAGVGVTSEGFGTAAITDLDGFAVVVFAVAGVAYGFLDIGFGAFLGGGAAIEVGVGGGGVFFAACLAFVAEAAVLAFGGVDVEAHADAAILGDGFAGGTAIGVGGANSHIAGAILEAACFGLGDAEADQASLASACGVALLLGADVADGTGAGVGFGGRFGGCGFGDDFTVGCAGVFTVGCAGVFTVGVADFAVRVAGAVGAAIGDGAIGCNGARDAFFGAAGEFADEVFAFCGTVTVGLTFIGRATGVEAGSDDDAEHHRQEKTYRTRHARFSFGLRAIQSPFQRSSILKGGRYAEVNRGAVPRGETSPWRA